MMEDIKMPRYNAKARAINRTINARKANPLADAEYLAGLPGPNTRTILLPFLKKHGVLWSEMVTDRREKILTVARQEMYTVLRKNDWSYTRIARLFHRDHTSVLWGVRRWEEKHGVDAIPDSFVDDNVSVIRKRHSSLVNSMVH
jgi:chromosomal replication initiation ATPase DnaA